MKIACLFFIFCISASIALAEEQYEDVTASVAVSSTFKISVDSASIDFGAVDPGEIVELYPERYFNEVRCASNNGRAWYLKAYCGDLTGTNTPIPASFLKFKIHWTNGEGVYSSNWVSFGSQPVLVYTGAGLDTIGQEVIVHLSYKLEPAPGITAGFYTALVTYTMTEGP